jgi:ribonucleoside-diphosphate reductase alpha chain
VLEVRSDDHAANAEGGENEPELPLGKPAARAVPRDLGDSGDVALLFQPLDRPEELAGHTYKVRWPDSDHALYITLNDIIQDGRRRPFEVFINSKNTEHYAWTVALTRMISAVFRRGGDVSFVVEELKAVFDPRGGHWMGGRYVPSLLAAIGEVIERHMIETGFLPTPGAMPEDQADIVAVAAISDGAGSDGQRAAGLMPIPTAFRQCPKCGQAGLVRMENCDTCTSCGYSKCS